MRFQAKLCFVVVVVLSVITTVSCSSRHRTPKEFPGPGIDEFKSVFTAEIEITDGPNAGQRIKLENLIDTAQSVARGKPFRDNNRDNASTFELPAKYSLPREVRDSDFPSIPEEFSNTGSEKIHLQITSLNAKSPDGRFRILAGQPLKDEFPELFKPAYGMVVSNVKKGFPARSFFVPYSVIVTPYGNLISNAPGFAAPIFAQQPITRLPPYGVDYVVTGEELLLSTSDPRGLPVAKIISLAHQVPDIVVHTHRQANRLAMLDSKTGPLGHLTFPGRGFHNH